MRSWQFFGDYSCPMNLSRPLSVPVMTLVVLVCMAPCPVLAQKKPGGSSYTIIPLSDSVGLVHSINASGEMVGNVSPTGLLVATHWSLNSQGIVTTTALDSTLMIGNTLVAFDSDAVGNNDQGIIVGALGDYSTGTGWKPVVWMNTLAAPQVLPVPLNPLAVQVEGDAIAVSNPPTEYSGLKAVVVGRYVEYFAGGLALTHAVAWGITVDDEITDACELGSAYATADVDEFQSAAVDINKQLTVVGSISARAMRWQLGWNGVQLSLQSTLDLFPSLSYSKSFAVNENGDICGHRAPYSEAFLLVNSAGTLVNQPLAQLVNNSREYSRSYRAAALNNLTVPQVVGSVSVFATRSHILNRWTEVLWKGSSVIDLEKATPSLTMEANYLTSINDAGWIAGNGWDGAIHRPVVLKPQ
ncbi:MAG: hypothetical protein ABL921_23950 [Pirellula sp.]